MERLEHIGIAVKDLNASNALFSALLRQNPYKTEEVESEGVRTSFFRIGGVKIELLESTKSDSPIAKFIANKGEGLHHLAFEVPNIEDSIAHYQEQGFTLIHSSPKDGADNKRIAFMHPKSTNGVLVELCQDKGS